MLKSKEDKAMSLGGGQLLATAHESRIKLVRIHNVVL